MKMGFVWERYWPLSNVTVLFPRSERLLGKGVLNRIIYIMTCVNTEITMGETT